MPHIIHDQPADTAPDTVRQQAIRQLQRKRRFRISAVWSAIGMAILVAIWAMAEYHNAGGWPTQGFSQSSGISGVWNIWIIYPLGAWLMILAAHAWAVYMDKPPSEDKIRREMQRQDDQRH
jgi:hypothetical protein